MDMLLRIPDDHPVSTFMDQFYINLHHKEITVGRTLREIFKTHKHIWNNESYRKLALDILVSIGTNMLLSNDRYDIANALCFAISVVVLEQYNGSTDDIDLVMNERVVASKGRDLSTNASSIGRDFLKFFRKRTTCKCLKKMHLEARKMPKMGLCWYCDKEMERVSLSVCSRCMIRQFCSRECQVADWPKHKKDCDVYVRAHQQHSSKCQD